MPSNPYLAFCRAWGVDYGDALSFVDAYKMKFDDNRMTAWHRRAVRKIRRETVKALIAIYNNIKEGGNGEALTCIVAGNFSSYLPYNYRFPLGNGLRIPIGENTHIIHEARWAYDMKEKENVFVCRVGIFRSNYDGEIIFLNLPFNIRYGYRVEDHEGIWRIEGDVSLFDTYEDRMEWEALQHIFPGD